MEAGSPLLILNPPGRSGQSPAHGVFRIGLSSMCGGFRHQRHNESLGMAGGFEDGRVRCCWIASTIAAIRKSRIDLNWGVVAMPNLHG